MKKPCSVEGCGRPHDSRGLCSMHATRMRRNGTLELQPKLTTEQRFWSKVVKPDDKSCWIWTSRLTRDGYGQFTLSAPQRAVAAHRFAYTLVNGEIPDGLEIDHICFTVACVNPRHLEAVTHAENMRRRFARRTHCKQGHEFTPDNTYVYKGARMCRTCNRECQRRRAAAGKGAAA